jgi:hypothetical protein
MISYKHKQCRPGYKNIALSQKLGKPAKMVGSEDQLTWYAMNVVEFGSYSLPWNELI